MSSFARMTEMDVDRVLMFGNGLYDYDHPIPRRSRMRSKASRETFGIDEGDSMGVVCSPSTGGLCSPGRFLSERPSDRPQRNIEQPTLSNFKRQWKEGGVCLTTKSHHEQKVKVTESGRTLESE